MSGTPCSSISPICGPAAEEERLRAGSPPLVLALPGSRTHEIERLATIFGETLGMVAAKSGPLEVVLPTVPHLVARLSELTSRWPIRPRIVLDEAEKHAAFRRARAALAASGTVTLELALAGVPSVAAYRVPVLEELMLRMMVRIHPVIKVRSVILANLVLGEFAIPEFLQERVHGRESGSGTEPISSATRPVAGARSRRSSGSRRSWVPAASIRASAQRKPCLISLNGNRPSVDEMSR